MKRKIILSSILFAIILFMGLLTNNVQASTYYNDEIYYDENYDGTVTVVAAGKFIESATIPSRINGKLVTRVKDFEKCTYLTKVTLPSSVTEICNYAFENCTALTSINIPSSVKSIGYRAFAECSALKSLSLPNSITEIESSAFQNCSSLTTINIPTGIDTLNSSLFEGCSKLKSISIPSNIKKINGPVFKNCTSLTTVTVPATVTDFYGGWYDGVFRGCTSLKTATINANVDDLPDYTFEGCTSLTSVTLANRYTEIGSNAFEGCTSLKTINMPTKLTKISNHAFENCKSLTSVNIPETIEEISSAAFKNCTGLTTIYIPAKTVNAGWYSDGALEGCINIKTVYFSKKLQEIDNRTLYGVPASQITIYGYSGTAAKTYATENGYKYVEIKPITNISLSGSSTVVKTKSTTIKATITPSDAYNKRLQWTSSNSSVAEVDYYTGKVTGKKAGTATITATAVDGTNKKATFKITVKPSDLPFTDVDITSWYYSAVKYSYKNDLIKGLSSTKFGPNNKLTRGMIVTILHRMEKSPNVSGTPSFKDVKDSKKYYYKAVRWAEKNKVVNGYKNGNFGPNDYITRQDLAVILKNFATYKKKNVSKTNNLSGFKDKAKVSKYALDSVKWAVGSGVITGNSKTKTINPKGNATRAEAAAMIQKYCENIGR